MTTYTQEDIDTMTAAIVAPFVRVRFAPLGGKSIMLVISLDPKEVWANGIMENSRYARFHLFDGRIDLFSGGRDCSKFRAGKVKSLSHAIARLQKWVGSH